MFEGDAETVLRSLSKVAELPRNSLIFPGVWCVVWVCGVSSLVPRPHPAFRRLQYGKAGAGLVSFLT